ncbi:MAG: hypothetical protein M3285_10955 [Actinomycetota bacterium]|nr:hypothetical protein [Actinomycetota bacterium]
MTRRWAWAMLGIAVLAAVGGGVSVAVAIQSRSQAAGSLEQALRLHRARVQVAEAQKALGSGDLSDAVVSGEKANEIALQVGKNTRAIAKLLRPLGGSARRSVVLGRRGTGYAAATRAQTAVAARMLGAISGYQRNAVRFASETNDALSKVLRELRRTNESFP